ncbi:hypothetical protein [Arthrobacter sp. zg-Y769]|uniref:hypothetical protein n=1 Tax=Arthrobacter sp. zg-Y769 TaxID=2894191 RepID=UPI001E5B7407|nr:hypothetical protein [Arthrobacter sp. zg-Y769]MCC9206438.1 hypothetical protein [Arthrobacter sp. zg-Y769]
MKKTLLSAAALILAAAGCSTGAGADGDSPSPPVSPAASAPDSGAAGSPTPTASPVALAEGFPSGLIPVMDGSEILSSTVDRANGMLTAVLVESSDAPAAEILAFYDARLVAQGFAATEAAAGSPSSRDYLRNGPGGPETVNITAITADGGPATVTVGATILAESAK